MLSAVQWPAIQLICIIVSLTGLIMILRQHYAIGAVYHAVCHSVSRMAQRVCRCRPNMVGMGKGWPSRSDQILVLRYMAWYDIFSLARGRHHTSPRQCSRVCSLSLHLVIIIIGFNLHWLEVPSPQSCANIAWEYSVIARFSNFISTKAVLLLTRDIHEGIPAVNWNSIITS